MRGSRADFGIFRYPVLRFCKSCRVQFMKKIAIACSFLLMPMSSSLLAQGDTGLKICISADVEGIDGVVSEEQLGPEGFECQRFWECMTEELVAAIAAARMAGATEILLSELHGNGQNLPIEKLPDDVMIVRSWPRELGMMDGIDAPFDGVIFISSASGIVPSSFRIAEAAHVADVLGAEIADAYPSNGSAGNAD
jgi:D-amino peptidase